MPQVDIAFVPQADISVLWDIGGGAEPIQSKGSSGKRGGFTIYKTLLCLIKFNKL